ncbi:TIR domain-containing protein [candidate division KSB1 bacterium]|nr:TIR domain-containing protein [candidate division KSB1 bacterium]
MSKPLVFISYSHKDKEWVKDYLLANLEKNNIPCHIDYRAGALVKQKNAKKRVARAFRPCRYATLTRTNLIVR